MQITVCVLRYTTVSTPLPSARGPSAGIFCITNSTTGLQVSGVRKSNACNLNCVRIYFWRKKIYYLNISVALQKKKKQFPATFNTAGVFLLFGLFLFLSLATFYFSFICATADSSLTEVLCPLSLNSVPESSIE